MSTTPLRPVSAPNRVFVALLGALLLVPNGTARAATATASNAGNSGHGAHVSVSERTGGVSLQVPLFSIPGIVPGMGAELILTYQSDQAVSGDSASTAVFGLPTGWGLSLAYIVPADSVDGDPTLHVDAETSYSIDADWTTQFTAAGTTTATPVKTGLKLRNLVDTQYKADAGSLTVNGIASAWALKRLDGTVRYLSANGLQLAEVDRFGNQLQYQYTGDTDAANARLSAIVDTWGNTIGVDSCTSGEGCTLGTVTFTLPDGRTVGYVAPSDGLLSQYVDPYGNITHFSWGDNPCQEGPTNVLTGITTPMGGFTALAYSCLNVCTAVSQTSCLSDGNTTTWPVVETLTDCPSATSGSTCAPTSASDNQVTLYGFGSGESPNYTGFPLYSPYAPADPDSDALMASNDTSFSYSTTQTRLEEASEEVLQITRQYDFLHLLEEESTAVRAQSSSGSYGLMTSKQVSYCYPVGSGQNCALGADVSYSALPANYETPTAIGSCVYEVGPTADGSARRSTTEREYDAFGNLVHEAVYHGTQSTAITESCAGENGRLIRLATSDLSLVLDEYRAWDTPASLDSDGYLELGAGHYGLPSAQQSFAYLVASDGSVATTPARVALGCQTPSADGTVIATTTLGALDSGSAAPTTPGVIDACTSPSWDTSVEPPKATTHGYDSNGRLNSHTTGWGAGMSGPGTLTSVSASASYALDTSLAGEESCALVLETTQTDAAGQVTSVRQCTLNGFTLSLTDALGNQTFYSHDAMGLAQEVTYPNGTAIQYDFYHACPVAQDGATATCPATSTALGSCPYDSAGRSCLVETLSAGTDPSTGEANTSVADGVARITVKDGLGRAVTSLDDLGGTSGGGFTSLQTRKSRTYDSLGLVTSSTAQMGATDPLIYTTTTSYDPKRRPETSCGPRGTAHQFIHDDLAQQSRRLMNGQGLLANSVDDNRKLTEVIDCPVASGVTTEASGSCPTLASDTSEATCTGYSSTTTRDGGGTPYTVTASDASAVSGASLTSMAGTSSYSVGLLQAGYTSSALAADGAASTSASLSRSFDLLGSVLSTSGSISSGGTTASFASDDFLYDALGRLTAATTPLGLTETRTYTERDELATRTTTGGDTYAYYYDSMRRLRRRCYPAASGSEGENIERDPLTGQILTITKFTNAGACSECASGDCGDVAGDSLAMDYTAFGAITSMTWSDGTRLEWAYDQYHRQSCYADAVATALGESCPTSPSADGWTPDAGSLLAWLTYWDDDDPYRRGLLQSSCRGLMNSDGSTDIACQDTDYYTSADSGGSCDDTLADVVGAFAGQVKSKTQCSGGSCATGAGTPVLTSTTTYDAHRRPCTVTSTDAAGDTVLSSTYNYDQYDQLVSESHSSDLDSSDTSNYTMTYSYDGLLRLTEAVRAYAGGAAQDTTSYSYDGRGNPTSKTETTGAGGTATALAMRVGPAWWLRSHLRRWKDLRIQVWLHGSAATDLAELDLDSLRLDGQRPYRIGRLFDRDRDGYKDLRLIFRAGDLPEDVRPLVTALLGDGTALFAILAGTDTSTTTEYSYSPDGALTAMTVTPAGGQATTTYLVWDDFTPDSADPTTGTTSAGNGTLLGWGSSPEALTTTLGFDPRQRLTQVAGASTSVSYGFDARSYLASATSDTGETLELYHGPGNLARVANAFRTSGSTTQMCSWAGPLRHVDELEDNTLTASSGGYLLQPRKDVAGVYDPSAGTLSAYQYDPYGADGDDASDYDLTSNPWRYAGEFRDPTWGGYYLRARWYLPQFQTFASRDPAPNLSRYGYTGGNPIGRFDPSGHSYKSFAKGIDHFLADLDIGDSGAKGVLGALSSIFLAPIVGPAQVLADPQQFWQGKDFWVNDIVAIVGVAAELGGQALLARETTFIPWKHALVDAAVGLGGTTYSEVSSGRFSVKSTLQGLENTLGGILWAREAGGFGYDPYDTSLEKAFTDVGDFDRGEGAVYRFRRAITKKGWPVKDWTTPFLEKASLGSYHEGLVMFARDLQGRPVFGISENTMYVNSFTLEITDPEILGDIKKFLGGSPRLKRVGSFEAPNLVEWRRISARLHANPLNLPFVDGIDEDTGEPIVDFPANAKDYNVLRRNCHMHARAIARQFQ